MNRPERKRTISSRKDSYIMVTLFAMTGALIFRIPLEHMIGDKGVACFAAAYETYLVIAGTTAYGLSEAAAALVKFRVKREQYRNARKVLNGALLFGGILGLIFSVFFSVFGHFAAEKIMHMPLAGLSLSMMAPSMFFLIMTGAFRGYFQGSGSRIPSMHSKILHLIFMSAGSLAGAALFHEYGVKVSKLLQKEDFSSAYGAQGASIGLLSASVLCFLHVLVLYFLYRNSLRKQMGRELPKIQDTGFQIMYMLVGTGAIYSLAYLCFNGLPLIDLYLFFSLGGRTGEAVAMWGAYYGKCLVLIGVISGVIMMVCIGSVRKITGAADRQELRIARERLGILIHQCAVLTIPAAIFLAVLSGNFLDLLFSEADQKTAGWVQMGSILIVLSVFALLFMEILIKSRKMKYVAFTGAAALLLHIGLLFLLLETSKLGMEAVIIANIVFYALVAGAGFLLISRSMQYTQEWIKSFAVTIVASAVSGVIVMLLNKVFSPMLGAAVSMLVCLLTGIAVYVVLLIVTRAFHEGELEEMTGGRILIMLERMLHIS